MPVQTGVVVLFFLKKKGTRGCAATTGVLHCTSFWGKMPRCWKRGSSWSLGLRCLILTFESKCLVFYMYFISVWLPNPPTAPSRFHLMSPWQRTHVWATSLSLSDHSALKTHWQWSYLQTASVNVKTPISVTTHTAAGREESAVVFAGKLCTSYTMTVSVSWRALEVLLISNNSTACAGFFHCMHQYVFGGLVYT